LGFPTNFCGESRLLIRKEKKGQVADIGFILKEIEGNRSKRGCLSFIGFPRDSPKHPRERLGCSFFYQKEISFFKKSQFFQKKKVRLLLTFPSPHRRFGIWRVLGSISKKKGGQIGGFLGFFKNSKRRAGLKFPYLLISVGLEEKIFILKTAYGNLSLGEKQNIFDNGTGDLKTDCPTLIGRCTQKKNGFSFGGGGKLAPVSGKEEFSGIR